MCFIFLQNIKNKLALHAPRITISQYQSQDDGQVIRMTTPDSRPPSSLYSRTPTIDSTTGDQISVGESIDKRMMKTPTPTPSNLDEEGAADWTPEIPFGNVCFNHSY